MENIQSIRARIKTIHNIQKAANAMKLISSIKLTKINKIDVQSLKSSVNILENILSVVAAEALYKQELPRNHWLNRIEGKSLLIVLSTDQGFCGSFKQSIMNKAALTIKNYNIDYIEVFGKKEAPLSPNICDDQFVPKGAEPDFDRTVVSRYDIEVFANKIKNLIINYIFRYEVFKVYIISGEYRNITVQVPRCVQIFPIKIRDFRTFNSTFIPGSKEELLEILFDQYLYSFCFDITREHLLSELSIRVFSMDKTVRNADDMCKKLTLLYNRTRQAKITQELTEIVSSVECIN